MSALPLSHRPPPGTVSKPYSDSDDAVAVMMTSFQHDRLLYRELIDDWIAYSVCGNIIG